MQTEISPFDDGPAMDEETRARLTEFLRRFEQGLTDEDLEPTPVNQFARDVQDQIHDQYRQF